MDHCDNSESRPEAKVGVIKNDDLYGNDTVVRFDVPATSHDEEHDPSLLGILLGTLKQLLLNSVIGMVIKDIHQVALRMRASKICTTPRAQIVGCGVACYPGLQSLETKSN